MYYPIRVSLRTVSQIQARTRNVRTPPYIVNPCTRRCGHLHSLVALSALLSNAHWGSLPHCASEMKLTTLQIRFRHNGAKKYLCSRISIHSLITILSDLDLLVINNDFLKPGFSAVNTWSNNSYS
jgi:hypothetical protein